MSFSEFSETGLDWGGGGSTRKDSKAVTILPHKLSPDVPMRPRETHLGAARMVGGSCT